MRLIIKLLCFFLVISSCNKTEVNNVYPDLIVYIKSRTDKEYGLLMNYPVFKSCDMDKFYPVKNKYILLFALNTDSSEYTIKNFNNMKEFYFTLKYNHQIIENYNENDIRIKFSDFQVLNSSADSFIMRGNELWMYCD